MSNDLYFIPILTEALRQPNRKGALIEAFARIRALGEKPEFRTGYAQFEAFLRVAAEGRIDIPERLESDAADVAHGLAIDLVSGFFDQNQAKREAALAFLLSRPQWLEVYTNLLKEFDDTASEATPADLLRLEKDGETIETVRSDRAGNRLTVPRARPGHYAVKLISGRLVWEGDLSAEDLIWSAARPGQDLDLAAATGEAPAASTRRESLLGGQVVLTVFPGPESGSIHITIKESTDADR